jgi:hypothetical protein
MTKEEYEALVAAQHAGRYPNNLTFAWLRSDGDYEIVGTLNGETIDDNDIWNNLVEQTLAIMKESDEDTEAYNREDVVSVLIPDEDEEWTPVVVKGAE